MSGVDSRVFEDLLDVLDDADQRLLAADLDARYAEMESTGAELDSWLGRYAAQLAGIELDVDNVRQINATLPRTCFKKIDLEPVEPEPATYYHRRI